MGFVASHLFGKYLIKEVRKVARSSEVAKTTDTSCYSVAAFNYSRKNDPRAQPTQTFGMVEPILSSEMQGLCCLINEECVL